MHTVQLEDGLYKKLEAMSGVFGVPKVIELLLAHYEENRAPALAPDRNATEDVVFMGGEVPPLTHSRVLSASINGSEASSRKWNGLLIEVIEAASDRLGSVKKVTDILPLNVVDFEKNDEGYKFYPKLGVSIQGQSAEYAARGIIAAAKKAAIPIRIRFHWRDKEGAYAAGETGVLVL